MTRRHCGLITFPVSIWQWLFKEQELQEAEVLARPLIGISEVQNRKRKLAEEKELILAASRRRRKIEPDAAALTLLPTVTLWKDISRQARILMENCTRQQHLRVFPLKGGYYERHLKLSAVIKLMGPHFTDRCYILLYWGLGNSKKMETSFHSVILKPLTSVDLEGVITPL